TGPSVVTGSSAYADDDDEEHDSCVMSSCASFTLELRLALVEERIEARLEILTAEDFCIPGRAGCDGGARRSHCFDDLFGCLYSQRGIRRQGRRQGLHLGLELRRLHDLIY